MSQKKVYPSPAEKCCVVGCKNNSLSAPNVKFYRFPESSFRKEQRDKWIRAIRIARPDGSPWEPSKRSRICSDHFVGCAKSNHPLSPSFVPLILPEHTYGVSRFSREYLQRSHARFARAMRRSASSAVYFKDCNARPEPTDNLSKPTNNLNKPAYEPAEPARQDVGIQIYIPQINAQDALDALTNIFICNLSRDGSLCKAETQCNFSNRLQVFAPKKRLADKSCGTNIDCVSKGVGTDLEYDTHVNNQAGFCGFATIKKEEDLLDLAGEFSSQNYFHFKREITLSEL